MAILETSSSIAIIGHSHVECLISANERLRLHDVELLNIRNLEGFNKLKRDDLVEEIKSRLKLRRLKAICLCLAGNTHNVFGLREHPQRFSIGNADSGVVPDDQDRYLIPYQVMLDSFRQIYSGHFRIAEAIYSAFPMAKRIYLNPPPPVTLAGQRLRRPVAAEQHREDSGPDGLRMQLYRVQTVAVSEIAEKLDASFIRPSSQVLDTGGFLLPDYFDTDPTHGNSLYGELMLKKIVDQAEAA